MRTSLIGVAVGGALILGSQAPAHAQYTPPGLTLSGAPRPAGMGGFRVGESTYLRAGVAAEAGYDTNVFYNDVNRQESATLRVTPSIEITNSMRDGNSPPLHFALGASLLYREYLKDNPAIREQRAFNPTAFGTLGYNSGGGTAVSISDQFTRLDEPPYAAGEEPIVHDANLAIADLSVSPGGGRITSLFRYTNQLDLFETDGLGYGDRMMHDVMVDGSWKWLPKTALFLQAGGGYTHYLEATSYKSNSIPYRFLGGLRGLITPKLTMSVSAGYADAVYLDQEPEASVVRPFPKANPSGLSNLAVGVGLQYTPITYTTLTLAYGHEFRDSPLLGDYYDLDYASASIAQQLGAFVLSANGRYEYRRYKGMQVRSDGVAADIARNDNIWLISVQADYFLQRWFYVGVGYASLINRATIPDSATPIADDIALDYTKHLIVGRLGITY
jgi:hypothetical protein